ncbi:efflux RND transporter periplasmic adaptor subunit [Anaerolinea sp.]|uniref:efflux RND transporter periplasmic adaptor subunit n=1 Tax=Anaerolinea sp. TaxID=1872519 RepID=UPI002ACE1AE0|nr:efflux RND transporter periplasmic adaptor subunit [Anaerolinea sp.]
MKRWVFYLLSVLLMGLLVACSSTSETSNFETAKLETGSISAVITTSGAVRPVRSADLTWQISGKVQEVHGEIGDTVQDGQELARLAEDSLPQNVLLAWNDYLQAEEYLKDLQDTQPELAQAQMELAQAQEEYEKVEKRYRNFNPERRNVSQATIDTAKADLALAEKNLEMAQKYFDLFKGRDANDPERAEALKMLAKAQQARDSAYFNYLYVTGKPSDTEAQKIQAELALAKSRLNQAKKKVEELSKGVSTLELTAAQARLRAAQQTLDQVILKAPFAGTITNRRIQPGDVVTAGTLAFQMEDRSHLYVEVNISEIEINDIHLEQEATLTFDALPEKTYHGRVVQIGLSGNNQQGAVTYPVTIEITDADENIKSGMTAMVQIETRKLDQVLLVPNRAVRVLNGQRVVFVKKNTGLPEAVPITLGVSSATHSQILKGDVKEGDEVILNPDLLMQLQEQGGNGVVIR